MKAKIRNILLTVILFLIYPISCLKAQNTDSTHTRPSVFYWDDYDFVFYNTNEDAGFIANFPLVKIEQKIPEDVLNGSQIDYNIYTSVENAELAVIERFETTNIGMYSMIDSMLPNGPIGNNCWHQLRMGAIRFIRNNVFVSVYSPGFSNAEYPTVEELARKIDSILIESDKVYNEELIPSPEIQSIEIVSDLPENWDDNVELKINATDPNSQQLNFRQYGAGSSFSSNKGDLKVYISEYMKTPEDLTIARVKIWVRNEDNIVELIEYDIPLKSSTNVNNSSLPNYIKIYPNPTNETFAIETQNTEISVARLFNSTGELIKTLPVENGINSYNIPELKSGIYFIQVLQKENVIVKKLVKN